MRSSVVDALRERIITGALPPGSRIAEETISSAMGLSRGPVREALRELENEGLVVSNAYRGTVVNEVTTDELRDVLIPVRLTLETHACLRALPHLSESNFRFLQSIVDEMRAVPQQASSDITATILKLVELDVQFHEYLTDLGGQYHASQIWRLIQPRIRMGFFQLGQRHSDLAEIAEEHEELLNQLRTLDPATVEAALREHIATTQLALLTDGF